MATIKSYTDINQSKKLAEILPLDSADMEYLVIKENGKLVGGVPFVKDDSEVEDSAYNHVYDRIHCWSLAALLKMLPLPTLEETMITTTETKWQCTCEPYAKYWSELHNDAIDAVFEMVIWLKEKNLL